jgi:protein TonB
MLALALKLATVQIDPYPVQVLGGGSNRIREVHMFNLLVESTKQSRRRTPKYFLLTFLAYASIMGAAVVGSIMFYSPALADTFDTLTMIAPPPPEPPGGPVAPKSVKPRQVEKYVSATAPLKDQHTVIPHDLPPDISVFNNSEVGPSTGGSGGGIGPGNGVVTGLPPSITTAPPPEPPKVEPAPERKPDVAKPDNKIYKVSGMVKLGKAIYIPTPAYPPLARNIRLEGTVKVELVVDKSGHVISAAAVSGPDMLKKAAVDAALRSTFKPTLLSGEPVIVQAVFTFNFKLNN